MKWLRFSFGNRPPASEGHFSRRVTYEHPLLIQDPKVGFLSLMGPLARPLIEEDAATLKTLFSSCLESNSETPICDVLMIYARIEANGAIQSASQNLREIIEKSHASIVVVATENDGQSYIAASKRPGAGKANLVMTLARNGQGFGNFFKELFTMMHRGVTMPMAWVKLAPQIPGMEHKNVPETICAMEVTHVIFTSGAPAALVPGRKT